MRVLEEGLFNGQLGRITVKVLGRQEGLRSRLAWETGWSFALKVANAGLGFLSTVLLARLLGAERYGVYAYALSLVTLLALPAHAGLPDLILRETAKGLSQQRLDLVKGAWWWAGRVVAVISFLVVGIGGPILVAWHGGLKSPTGQTMAWALALVPLMALGNLRGAALRGLQRVVLGQLPEFLLRPGLFLLFVGGAALVWGGALSPPVAMILQATASFLAFVAGAWLLWRYTPTAVRQAQPAVDARGWLSSSVVFALLAGYGVVNQQASTVILGLFEAPDAVGRFRVAVQVATLAASGLNAINLVVAPRFADLWAQGQKARLQRLVTRSAQVMLAVNLAVGATFLLVGRSFFRLVFGPEFVEAFVPLLILLVGHLVDSAAGPAGTLLNMTGHEKNTLRAMAWASGLNIAANLALVPFLGMTGSAAATALSMATWKTLFWWHARKQLGINSFALPIGNKL